MGRHAGIARAPATRARTAKLEPDGAAPGDEGLKAEGRRREAVGRIAQPGAKAARRTAGH
ncbi:hypothetical protein [Streptomyces sp. NPDC091416]|uniref:hypothetical protein n=1 Tax=Streptomyces sp. NPDC091416 TaxID=3366003 RepID=UPI0038195672